MHDWIALLEKTYIVFRLTPYHRNFNKRIVKSPKLYFYDVGLAAYLLGLTNQTQMARDPLRGHLFENMVVVDLIKKQLSNGEDANLHFFRDSNGNEIDVIYPGDQGRTAIEIKSGQTVNEDYFRGFKYISKIAGSQIALKILLYAGTEKQTRSDGTVMNFHSFLNQE